MKILKVTIIFMFAFLSTAMVQSDRKARVKACAEKAGHGAIYLREFVVSLPKAVRHKPRPVYRQTLILRGNNIYRFNLCNEKGRAVIRIYDRTNMVVSSFESYSRKELDPINFLCRKTGQYTIMIYFKGGRAGKAVGIMSHVMK